MILISLIKIPVMTRLILIISLFNLLNCYSQNMMDNNSKDTIYIYFKHSKKEIEKKPYTAIHPKGECKRYVFEFEKRKHYYSFANYSYRRYEGGLIEVPIVKKKKKFLKKIKNKTFTYCDFKDKTFSEIAYFYIYNSHKTIYLIDKKENKKGNIYLRKVSFYSPYNSTE